MSYTCPGINDFIRPKPDSSTAQTAEAELKSGQMKPRQNVRIVEQKFLEALNLALNGANTQTNAEK
jgi:hypothetical protein